MPRYPDQETAPAEPVAVVDAGARLPRFWSSSGCQLVEPTCNPERKTTVGVPRPSQSKYTLCPSATTTDPGSPAARTGFGRADPPHAVSAIATSSSAEPRHMGEG